MRDPIISVIMPTWNRADFIHHSINAVLKQTFNDLELIIVDDGSTDETETVISSYKDKRIKYLKQPHSGPSAARNLGIEHAKGKWISFCDSDDVYFLDRLQQYYKLAQEQEGLIYSGWVRFLKQKDDYLIMNIIFGFEKDFDLDLFQYKNIFPSSAAMLNRSCLDRVGRFDEKLTFSEDWELFLRVSDHYPVRQVKKPTFFYQVGFAEDPRKKHHTPEVKNPALKYIAQKRMDMLLASYLTNKDSGTAKKILLASGNSDDAEAKKRILSRLESLRTFTGIQQLIEKHDSAGFEELAKMSRDQLIGFLIKNTPLNIKVDNELFEKEDFLKLQAGISSFYQ